MPLQKKPGSGALLKFSGGPLQNECCCGDGCECVSSGGGIRANDGQWDGNIYQYNVWAGGSYVDTTTALPGGNPAFVGTNYPARSLYYTNGRYAATNGYATTNCDSTGDVLLWYPGTEDYVCP